MQDLLKKLTDTVNHAQKVVEAYTNDHNKVKDFNDQLKKKESELIEKASSLSARENAVRDVENAVALKAEAQKLMSEAKAMMADAVKGKDELQRNIHVEMDRLASARALVAQEDANVEKKKKILDAEVEKRVNEIIGKLNLKK